MLVMNFTNRLIELFYPTRCLVCGQAGRVVHSACRNKLPYIEEPFCHRCCARLTGKHCSSTLCRMADEDRALTGVRSVFWHEGGAREAVLRLKYRGVASLTEWAAEECRAALNTFQLDGYFQLLMPVPLHPLRLRKRGYNQAAIVAQALALRSGLNIEPGLMLRTRLTRSQVELNGLERALNLRDAFSWTGPPLTGQRVLLFDDVCTTGATLNESAGAIKAAGASEVWALTLTREV